MVNERRRPDVPGTSSGLFAVVKTCAVRPRWHPV